MVPADAAPGRAFALLALNTAAVHAAGPFAWLPLGLALLGVASVTVAAALLFAPLRPRRLADGLDRRRAAALIRRHGSDTLSAFKLRNDVLRRVARRPCHGRLARRGRDLLVAGDPVGAAGATSERARRRERPRSTPWAGPGRRRCQRGVRRRRPRAGLAAPLPGRRGDPRHRCDGPRRRRTQEPAKGSPPSERHGYGRGAASRGRVGRPDDHRNSPRSATVAAGWPERGFSMADDALVDELLPDAVVVARPRGRRPCAASCTSCPFRSPQVSLGFMRRDRDTPNGLTEFLVVRCGAVARRPRDRGVLAELRGLRSLAGRREPAGARAGRLLRVGDRWFQVERLERFNAKFDPRWQPRFLLFDGVLAMPRIAVAALCIEGQLPKPRPPLRRPSAASAQVVAAGGP